MKKFHYWLLMLFPLFCACTRMPSVPEGAVVSMEYRIDNATRYPEFHFILRREADGRYLLTNASGCDPEEARTIEVPAAFADSLRRIVIEEKMTAYKEHYSSWSNRYVSGGTFWCISIGFEGNDEAVKSSGYMTYPKGNGLNRIQQLCEDTWQS